MKQSKSEGNVWPYIAASAVIVIMLAAIRWSLAHPYGIHWDEALYLNDIQVDVQRLQTGRLLRLCWRILIKSAGRPPAFRILALPFLALFGSHTTAARLVSLACFGWSSWFVYMATCRIASRVAGAFAVLVFALSPEVISASLFFSTDTPLYLATSAMLYYLFVSWSDEINHSRSWIGLGLAIGLGFLSKVSFLAIAPPVFVFWFVISRCRRLGIPNLASQWKAGAIALLVVAPWWLLNLKAAVVQTRSARGFVRDSLGPPSIATWLHWLSTVVQGLLGCAVSILIFLILIAYFQKAVLRKEVILDSFQRVALGACACAGVPILIAQLSGTNHELRHITPAVIPLAIAIGVLADRTGWVRYRAYLAVSSALFCCQLIMLVTPVVFPNDHPVDLGFVNGSLPWRVMVRFDQWDWRPVRDLSYRCGIAMPKISFLGSGRAFCPPQIEYPWVVHETATRKAVLDFPDVTWLWRYEDGPIDWGKVMDTVGRSDIVLTAPHYLGEVKNKEDLDNQYNAEFASRLSQDPRFRGPIRLEMGRFEPVEVDVFLKKSLVCQSGQQASNNQ